MTITIRTPKRFDRPMVWITGVVHDDRLQELLAACSPVTREWLTNRDVEIIADGQRLNGRIVMMAVDGTVMVIDVDDDNPVSLFRFLYLELIRDGDTWREQTPRMFAPGPVEVRALTNADVLLNRT